MCVLLERKIEEDNAPSENRKRSPKVGSHVLKSTKGKKNERTRGKEHVFTAQKYEVVSYILLNIFFDISVNK